MPQILTPPAHPLPPRKNDLKRLKATSVMDSSFGKRPVFGMILKGYPRISETFISNEIGLLEQQGLKIHIFSMRRPRESFAHRSVRDIRAKVDYLPETILPHLAKLLPANLRLAGQRPRRYAAAAAIAVRRFFRTYKSATLKHLLQAGYLVQHLLPGSGVVHLHAHFAHSPTSVAMFTNLLSGVPFSFTAHAKDVYTSNPRQLREKIDRARFVTTCTGYNRRYLMKLAPRTTTPIHRIYHGIDLALFNAVAHSRNGAGSQPAPPYHIMTVARMTAKKGLPTVYRALRKLLDQGIAFEHVLIGDGDDRQSLLALVESLGLTSVCRFLGTQPHDIVLDHYRRADLFVLGCRVAKNGDRDGIPNVFPESMAMGVPVVATRVSAIPEIIRDGRTGLLVPPDNPREMAGAMTRLLTDVELRQKVIANGRRQVHARFDNRRLIQSLADIYSAGLRQAGGA